MHRLCLLFLVLGALSSCKRDALPMPQPPVGGGAKGRWSLVACEGNYTQGNASLHAFSATSTGALSDAFRAANARGLGDVVQSLWHRSGEVWAVVNNSGRLEVMHDSTFASLHTISGLGSPRYLIPVSATKAYVTDLYANRVHVVSLTQYAKVGQIPLSGWCEQMAVLGGKVWVCNYARTHLYGIDPITDAVTDSISLGTAWALEVVVRDNRLWVATRPPFGSGGTARLMEVDVQSRTATTRFTFPESKALKSLQCTPQADTLFALSGANSLVRVVGTQLTTLATASSGANWYGLGLDPISRTLWVADALDYVQPGRIVPYSPSGQAGNPISVGFIPSSFIFYTRP